MRILLVLFTVISLLACASQPIQPVKTSGIKLGAEYPDIKAYIEGKKEFQDMSPDAQKAYMSHKTQIEVLGILDKSNKISGQQMIEYLKQESIPDIKAVVRQDQSISDVDRAELTKKIEATESKYDLEVPQEVDHVYVIFQRPGPLVDGSSQLYNLVGRSEFIQNIEEYRAAARASQSKLVITAATAGETEWIHSKIKFRGQYLRHTLYRDSGTLHQNFPGVEVPLD